MKKWLQSDSAYLLTMILGLVLIVLWARGLRIGYRTLYVLALLCSQVWLEVLFALALWRYLKGEREWQLIPWTLAAAVVVAALAWYAPETAIAAAPRTLFYSAFLIAVSAWWARR